MRRAPRLADRHGRQQGRWRGEGIRVGRRRHRWLCAAAQSRTSRPPHAVRLPLVGEFQIENALVAAGLAIGTGSDAEAVFRRARTSRRRQGPAGAGRRAQRRADLCRLRAQARRAGQGAAGAAALCQAQAGGGVRRRRRPRCRQASDDGRDRRRNADSVIVTDDNPRSENPAAIRAAISPPQRAPKISATAPRRSEQRSPVCSRAMRC